MSARGRPSLPTYYLDRRLYQPNLCTPKITLEDALSDQREKGLQKGTSCHRYHLDSPLGPHSDQCLVALQIVTPYSATAKAMTA